MPASDPSPSDFLADPLSPLSRAERRNLLLASFVGCLISKVGLVPTKIAALGVDLSAPQQAAFTLTAAAVVVYFLLAFVSYSVPDFLIWRKAYQDYLTNVEIANRNWSHEGQMAHDDLHEDLPSIQWLYRSSPWVALLRLLFDYMLPLLFAGYSIHALLSHAFGP